MSDFIRVTDDVKPKREYTIPAASFDPEFHKPVDKPALNTDGTQVPTKYTPESLSSSGQKATPPKENDK